MFQSRVQSSGLPPGGIMASLHRYWTFSTCTVSDDQIYLRALADSPRSRFWELSTQHNHPTVQPVNEGAQRKLRVKEQLCLAESAVLSGSRRDERNADGCATPKNRPGCVCLLYRLSGWSPSGSGRPCRTWCGR